MAATIFSGNEVKTLKDTLSLNDKAKVIPVNADPSSGAGVAAPIGSLALDYSSGKVYRKTGSLATEWQSLGSGVGGINYIGNSDAESGTTGWATYADAAGAAPVDGTGGTANITWSRSTSSPLRGIADFNLVKDAVNRQGEGVSYDFTIDAADLAKVLTVSFDYEILSGTYATGDIAVYLIQDPAGTPVVIQPAGYQVQAATVGTKLREIATFQTASNVTSYRLCIHVASTSASAYSLAIDNVQVGPQVVQYGAPVTDWQDYTPTITASITNPTIGNSTLAGKWRRVGDSMQVQITWILGSTGGSGTGLFNFSLPAGFSFDANKVSGPTTAAQNVLGQAFRNDAGTAFYTGNIYYQAANSVRVLSTGDWSATFPHTFQTGDSMSLEFIAPILGWSSTVQMSNDTDTRVIAAGMRSTVTHTTTANVAIPFNTVDYDTAGATNLSQGRFTAPVPGIYRVSLATWWRSSGTGNSVFLCKNGQNAASGVSIFTFAPTATFQMSGSIAIQLNAGDYIDIKCDTSSIAMGASFQMQVERLSGPSAIAASETVAARYVNTAGTALSTSGTVALPFITKIYDTHGAFNGTTFTAPISGKYQISSSIVCSAVTLATSGEFRFDCVKNGSVISRAFIMGTGAAGNQYNVSSRTIIDCVAGDMLDVRSRISTAANLSTTSGDCWICIERIGN